MGSQMHEAEYLLKQFKWALLAEHAGRQMQNEASVQVSRINAELHRFAQVQNRAHIGRAAVNLYGQDVWERIKTEAARLERDAREELGVPPC